MTRCIRPRAGAAWPLALPMIPYMRANLAAQAGRPRARRRGHRGQLDDRRRPAGARAGARGARRLHVIPNPVDVTGAARACGQRSTPPIAGPYALYLGKLAPNKGTSHLMRTVAERAELDWPLVIAGDGPERDADRRRRGAVGPGHPADRLGRSGGRGSLAGARVDADLHVARTRVAQPRADRGERARAADRRHEHRRHAATSSTHEETGLLSDVARGARRRRAPAARRRGAAPAARRGGDRTRRSSAFDARRDAAARSSALYRELRRSAPR